MDITQLQEMQSYFTHETFKMMLLMIGFVLGMMGLVSLMAGGKIYVRLILCVVFVTLSGLALHQSNKISEADVAAKQAKASAQLQTLETEKMPVYEVKIDKSKVPSSIGRGSVTYTEETMVLVLVKDTNGKMKQIEDVKMENIHLTLGEKEEPYMTYKDVPEGAKDAPTGMQQIEVYLPSNYKL